MDFGKISFNDKIDWSKWTFKDFESTFAGQIAVNCNESVKIIAETLGVQKIPKEKTKDESQ